MIGATMREDMKPLVLLSSAIVVLASMADGNAKDLTDFRPDIVVECRKAGTVETTLGCQLSCYNTSVTVTQPGSPSVTWPSFGYRFSRIEFYARDNRPSENWLVALDGNQTGDHSERGVYISFLTIGTSSICKYTPDGSAFEVKLLKHY